MKYKAGTRLTHKYNGKTATVVSVDTIYTPNVLRPFATLLTIQTDGDEYTAAYRLNEMSNWKIVKEKE